MTNQLEALIAEMKAAAELIADGYRREWKSIHDTDNGVARVGCIDDDGELSPFVEVSISNYSGDNRHDIELADFYVKANPANVQALIAALEQSNKLKETFRIQSNMFCADANELKARVEELESQRQMAFMASNRWADKFRDAEKKIAELEASQLAVKLPKGKLMQSVYNTDHADIDAWVLCISVDSAIEAIRAAGGTVQGG